MVKDALDLLLEDKLVNHDGPSTLISSLNHQEAENRDILHLLHYITEKRSEDIYTVEDVIPLYMITMKIYVGDKKVQSVSLVPENLALSFKQEGQYITFTLQEVKGHNMISIQFN